MLFSEKINDLLDEAELHELGLDQDTSVYPPKM